MKIVICCVVKYENDYLLEWVEYHLKLGFSQIHIFDNNNLDGEIIQDVIFDKRFNKKVLVHDVRGQKYIQNNVYNHFYHHFDFDWCAFIDIDEFITFSERSSCTNIIDFLRGKSDFDAIHVSWKCYGDNGKVYREVGNVIDRFPRPICPLNFRYNYDFPENNHVKTIIKKGLDIKWDNNPHTPSGTFKICDEQGNLRTNNSPFKEYSFETIFIRHYLTKSIEEYSAKIIRQCADCEAIFYDFSKFYRINRLTIKKIKTQNRLIKKYSLYTYRNSIFSSIREYLKFRILIRYNIYPFFKNIKSRRRIVKSTLCFL